MNVINKEIDEPLRDIKPYKNVNKPTLGNRNRFEIIYDILKYMTTISGSRRPLTKTGVAAIAQSPPSKFYPLLNFMLERDLIVGITDENKEDYRIKSNNKVMIRYTIGENGYRYMEKYRELNKVLSFRK